MCARYQANPKESHLSVVKRIMRYLLGTINRGLWYPKNSSYNSVGYLTLILLDAKLIEKVLVALVISLVVL